MQEMSFPSFDIKFAVALPREIILMLLGGRKSSAEWLSQLDFYQSVWAVDSGAELCMAAQIIPERLIGDCDSTSTEAWDWAKQRGAKVSFFASEKDLTDFQLALELLIDESGQTRKGVFLTGAFGGRLDHLISLIYSLTEWSEKYLPIGMADEQETLLLLHGGDKVEIKFKKSPLVISLLPLEDSGGVSISGVRWPLEKVMLERARPYSISNRPVGGGVVTVEVKEGLVGLYCLWAESQLI